jgi:hypothetical protein
MRGLTVSSNGRTGDGDRTTCHGPWILEWIMDNQGAFDPPISKGPLIAVRITIGQTIQSVIFIFEESSRWFCRGRQR